MRTLLALATLLIASFASGQPPSHGKSDAQILAMGYDKWFDFYTAKAGGSNLDMIEASHAYQRAAARRNDRLLKNLDRPAATDLRRLRTLLNDYSGQCSIVGSYLAGGGSMWSVMDAQASARIEDVLYVAAGRHRSLAGATTASEVTRELMQAQLEVVRHRRVDAEGRALQARARAADEQAQKDFTSIAAIAAHLDRAKSDAILGFCKDRIHSAIKGG